MSDSRGEEAEAILLVGHGTRDPAGISEFLELAQQVARRLPGRIVESCFLELAESTIDAAVARVASAGAERILVAPLLLFSAGHAQRDIPRAVEKVAAERGISRVKQCDVLGCDAPLVELSALRFREAAPAGAAQEPVPLLAGPSLAGPLLTNRAATPAEETLLLFVGRGSRDAEASAELYRFARLRLDAFPVGWLEIAFVAMAAPRLETAIRVVAGMPFQRIVVQPHLLFQGELLARINQLVTDAAAVWPKKEWFVAPHLGPHELVAEAILKRIVERSRD